MIRAAFIAMLVLNGSLFAQTLDLTVVNPSFEAPALDPDAFPAFPVVDGWIEMDVDTLGSQNTGVFLNPEPNTPGHLLGAEGRQLAFLGSELGNGLEQDVNSPYLADHRYEFTVGVGVSAMFPPAQGRPADLLELALFFLDANEPMDIVTRRVSATHLVSTAVHDFSVSLTVSPKDVFVDKGIGIAIRSVGQAGGFWDVDHVRLTQTNLSPITDPNDEE